MMKQVRVTVPATTANLGPGFDCLGLALGLYNEVTFTTVTTPDVTITVSGEGAGIIPGDASNLVVRAARTLFQHLGQQLPGLSIHQQNNIPVGSGLGSSAAAVLSGLLAANALAGSPLSPGDVLKLATQMEGHPDNVAPALYGHLAVVIRDNDELFVERVALPPLQVVVVLPDFDFPTTQARLVLPQSVPLADAIFNAGRLPLLVRALETADYSKLRLAMQDRLHQPYRLQLIPGAKEALRAAGKSGAAGIALSGAGPSVIAFAPDNHAAIGQVLSAAFSRAGLESRTWILPVDTTGSRVDLLNDDGN